MKQDKLHWEHKNEFRYTSGIDFLDWRSWLVALNVEVGKVVWLKPKHLYLKCSSEQLSADDLYVPIQHVIQFIIQENSSVFGWKTITTQAQQALTGLETEF